MCTANNAQATDRMNSTFMRLVLAFFLVVACRDLHAQETMRINVENWRKDLRDLEGQLTEQHVDLFHSVSKDAFEKAVSDLDRDIPTLSRSKVLVRFAQLLAMIGDGHTSFFADGQKGMEFRLYPVRFWSFSDGIYVIAAQDAYADLLGQRLVQIDNTTIEDAFSTVSTTISADNDMEYEYSVPFGLRSAELLHALEITESADQAEFVFESGARSTLAAMSRGESSAAKWRTANSLFKGESPPIMRLEVLFATPLNVEHLKRRQFYWFTYFEDQRALYFRYNVCWDMDNGRSFAEVTEELFQHLDSHPVERLIVDVRQNAGGEPLTAKPLIDELAKRRQFGREGRLFVLVGRRTYSAALTNAAHLRSRAGARVVGEHSRAKPNSPSEGRDIHLPRTKTIATVSTQFVERDADLQDAAYLPVEISAKQTFAAYQAAQDPVLETALKAKIEGTK